jgi:uncharacterized protein YprB with RNaseH-like and TPR domain
MTKLVFDIETIGKDWEELDEITQKYFIEKFEDRNLAEEKFPLFPSVGQIVAIGLFNPVSQKGGVFLVKDMDLNEKEELVKNFDFDLQIFPTEKDLLEKFWDIAKNYREFITFAGNVFDIPFLMFRSAVNKIRPTINLHHKDYHIDLLEKFSKLHPNKNPSLHLIAQAFGLPTPKDLLDGKRAPQFYKEGKIKEFVEYAYKDVVTTAKIYEIWLEYLNF